MKILAIETSTKACSAAILYDGVIFEQFELAPQKHANIILKMVKQCFLSANLKLGEIDYLVFGEGPGAFTGIRIAAGVIQGLALGWNKPVIAVSSLEALIWQGYKSTQQPKWNAFLDARMNEYYYQNAEVVAGKLLSSKISIGSFLDSGTIDYSQNGIGDIATEYPAITSKFARWQKAYPKASGIAEVASQRLDTAQFLVNNLPVPIYLRNNIANKTNRKKS